MSYGWAKDADTHAQQQMTLELNREEQLVVLDALIEATAYLSQRKAHGLPYNRWEDRRDEVRYDLMRRLHQSDPSPSAARDDCEEG